MVMGPTPPMVGVMAERLVRERISAARSPLMTPSSEAVPASTMQVPGEIIADVMRPGMPVAVTMRL